MKANEMLSSMQEFEVLPVPSSTKNCLGLGSFGIVKLARHRTSNKKYALKIVCPKRSLIFHKYFDSGEYERVRVRG